MTGSSFRKLPFGTFALFPKKVKTFLSLRSNFFSNFAASINPLNHTSCTRLQRVNKIFELNLSQTCLASSACRWGKTHLSCFSCALLNRCQDAWKFWGNFQRSKMGLWFNEKDASAGAKISGSIPIRVTLCVFPSHRGGSRVLPKTQKKTNLMCRGKKMKHLNQRLM